jgi:hypothetical protein
MAPDRSTSHAGTSVAGASTHSSKKSDDGGYVQLIFFEANVANIAVKVRSQMLEGMFSEYFLRPMLPILL